MERRNFAQILKEADVDIRREYDRLYSSFYLQKITDVNGNFLALREYCAMAFMSVPFRKTCITLDDFDDFFKIHYEKFPGNFDLNYLVSFCEYTYNLAMYATYFPAFGYAGMMAPNQIYMQQVLKVIDTIGYMSALDEREHVTIFVPKSAAAISVAEIIDPSLSYEVIEYNRHTLQGDLTGKKNILLLLYEKLEPQRPKLREINKALEDSVFTLFNNLNLRHNNIDEGQKNNYRSYVAKMPKKDLEAWYDETYQVCLLAFLELDNLDRMQKIKVLKQNLQDSTASGQP